jgi:hypothetical protein
VRVPQDANQDVQDAFQELNDEVGRLRAQVQQLLTRAGERDPDLVKRSELRRALERPKQLDFRDVFRGGPGSGIGFVPDPGGAFPDGLKRNLREDATWKQTGIEGAFQTYPDDPHQKNNVHGHLHVAGGIYGSKLTAGGTSDIFGDLRVSGATIPGHVLMINEDFVSGSQVTSTTMGKMGWSVATGGTGSVDHIAGQAGHPGIIRISSGTTNATLTALYHHSTVYPLLLGDVSRADSINYMEDIGSTWPTACRVIFSPSVLVDNPDGVLGFESLAADSNWFSITVDGSGTTRKDTGVAQALDSWISFEIRRNGGWDFYVNGTYKTTHSGSGENVPADTTATQFIPQLKSDGTNRVLRTDRIRVWGYESR